MAEHKYKYSLEELLQRTNGGLNIVYHYYGDYLKNNLKNKISLADISAKDNNPSSAIKPGSQNDPKYGVQIVEFNNDRKKWSAIDLVQAHEGLDFKPALEWAFQTFLGETRDSKNTSLGYEFKMRPADVNEKVGEYDFTFNDKLSDEELKYIGPYVTNGLCKHFNFKSCKEFTQIIKLKNKKTESYKKYGEKPVKMTKGAKDGHFIFVIDEDDFKKIYTPQTKDFRFQYAGDKPDNYVFGLDTLEKLRADYAPERYQELLVKYEDKRTPHWEVEKRHGYASEDDVKLPEVIIAGGDRDALNIASLGYPVVWLNSETAKYDADLHFELKKYAKKVIQLGDIDAVGLKQMNDRALKHIDLYTLYLPESLKDRSLYAKPGKDFTDWIKRTYSPHQPEKAKNIFKKMVKNAPRQAQFWKPTYDDAGNFKKYDIDNENLMHFMHLQGFYKYKGDIKNEQKSDSENDFYFIRLQNKIIRRQIKNQITGFPIDYLRERYESTQLINAVHRSPQITDAKLEKLDFINPTMKDSGKDYQMLYFKDQAIQITPDSIDFVKYMNLEYPVWETKILDHFVRSMKIKQPVDISKDDEGHWDVKINDKKNPFLQYLVNSSRIHWRKKGYDPFKKRIDDLIKDNQKGDESKQKTKEELDKEIESILDEQENYRQKHNMQLDEPGLTDEEIRDQKQCFVNKWYAFGFYLHNYRDDSKEWFPVAVDNEDSNDNDSNGRSGKSLLFRKCVQAVVNTFVYINAANIDPKHKDAFLLEDVEYQTTNVLYDDATVYFPWKEQMFNSVTGEWSINKKNKSKFTIPQKDRPVPAVTSNHGMPNLSESFYDRMLFVPFSDYYHAANKDKHQRELKVTQDIGQNLFSEFTEEQWLQYINTVAHAIQFAIPQKTKIHPPMDDVDKRNIHAKIGDNFLHDAQSYFFSNPESRFDTNIEKTDLYEAIVGSKSRMGMKLFKEKLKLWCDYEGLIFNPLELCSQSKSSSTNRIIYNVSHYDSTKRTEKIHIRLTDKVKVAYDLTDKKLQKERDESKNNAPQLPKEGPDDLEDGIPY